MQLKKWIIACCLGLSGILSFPEVSRADDECSQLDMNAAWISLFSQFNEQFDASDYAAALETTKSLQQICSRSPILNLSIAVTYRKLGMDEEARYYIKYAIELTENIAVSQDVLESMWSIRYEIEHSDIICDREEYDKLVVREAEEKKQLDDVTEALAVANAELSKRRSMMADGVETERQRNAIVMWTGAGIGIAGVAMLATGAAFAAIERKEQASDSFEVSNNQLTIKSKHYAYWTMLGVGIAATVAGAVMAGLGGYYYTHPISEDLAIQMDVGVSNISFGLTF